MGQSPFSAVVNALYVNYPQHYLFNKSTSIEYHLLNILCTRHQLAWTFIVSGISIILRKIIYFFFGINMYCPDTTARMIVIPFQLGIWSNVMQTDWMNITHASRKDPSRKLFIRHDYLDIFFLNEIRLYRVGRLKKKEKQLL